MEAMLDANPRWAHKDLADSMRENTLHAIDAQQWPTATASCVVRSEVSRRLGQIADMFDAQFQMVQIQYLTSNRANEYVEARNNVLALSESVAAHSSDRLLLFRCRVLAAECSYFIFDLDKKVPQLCRATDEVINSSGLALPFKSDIYFTKLISLLAFCADRSMEAVNSGVNQNELTPRLRKLAFIAHALFPDDFDWVGQSDQTHGIMGIITALELHYG